MKISLTVLEIVLSLARLNHLFTGPKVLVQSLKTCECISISKDRLFSKHTPQKQWKFVFFDKFRLTALLLLLMMAQSTIAEQQNVRTTT